MESTNLDLLKSLKHDRVITDEEYSSRILSFAKEYLIKDTKLDMLGVVEKGTYGGVIAAREPGAWEKLSVKVVSSEKSSKCEVQDWQSLKHPHILRLLFKKYIPQIDAYIFITELYTYTLETYLDSKWFNRHKNAPLIAKTFLKEILEGLDFLHKRNYSHMNLTAGNVCISKDNTAVITNFTSLKRVEEIPKEQEVLQHGPPEACKHFRKNSNLVLKGNLYDIWSYGILALNMFTKNYIPKKAPKLITSWCDDLYPVLFKILQKKTFKEYIQKAFPSSKLDKQTRSTMLNFVITSLRIFPQDRSPTDLLFQHSYFKMGGFLSAGEDAWDRKVKANRLWILKPSTARVIQIKKQSLEETVESLSKGDECKGADFCCNENKVQIKNSIELSRKIVGQGNGCKTKVSVDVLPNQSRINGTGSNASTIEPTSNYLEPEVFHELNEILQNEHDVMNLSLVNEVEPNTDAIKPTSHMEPKIWPETKETFRKPSELPVNGITHTLVDADFEEKSKPALLKIPTHASGVPQTLLGCISSGNLNIDAPSTLKNETFSKADVSDINEDNCCDINLKSVQDKTSIMSENYIIGSVTLEEMSDGKQFKYSVQDSYSNLSKGFIINDKTDSSMHGNHNKYQAEDITNIEWETMGNKNVPGSVDASSLSEVQTCSEKKEKIFRTNNTKYSTIQELITGTSKTVPSLIDVPNHLSRPGQGTTLVKAPDFELKQLYTSCTQEIRSVNFKDGKLGDTVVSQASELCSDKMTVAKTSEISQEKLSVVTPCGLVDKGKVNASNSGAFPQSTGVSQDMDA